MPSFEQPPAMAAPETPPTPVPPQPPENLPIEPEKKADPLIDPELKAPEPAPLAKEIVERYAAEGIDVAWLLRDDADLLASFEELPYPDQEARRYALRSVLRQIRQLHDEREGWDEKTSPEIEPPVAVRAAAAVSKKQFDPEARLAALRKKSKGILATLNSLPEDQREAAGRRLYGQLHADMEKFKEALLEQRRGVAKIIEGVRERIMASMETLGGKKLNEVVDTFDRAMIYGNPGEAKEAQAALSAYGAEINKRAGATENVYAAAMQLKKSELPEHALAGFVSSSAYEIGLNDDARDRVERAVEKIFDRRRAIDELMSLGKNPDNVFRICFGRSPVGRVDIIPGPVTVYFRCANLEDYALIHSGVYAQGRDKVSDEERELANRSKVVAGVASRAYDKAVENDYDMYTRGGILDSSLVGERVRLLDRLDGALIAENAASSSFLAGWSTYRHEEQHAIHHLIGQAHLDNLKERIIVFIQDLKSKEVEADAEVAELERESEERSERLYQRWQKAAKDGARPPGLDAAMRQMCCDLFARRGCR
ncbi:MAG: hypothetical protein AAB692_02805, partial [Patescibacteria group bacterium]